MKNNYEEKQKAFDELGNYPEDAILKLMGIKIVTIIPKTCKSVKALEGRDCKLIIGKSETIATVAEANLMNKKNGLSELMLFVDNPEYFIDRQLRTHIEFPFNKMDVEIGNKKCAAKFSGVNEIMLPTGLMKMWMSED